MDSAERLRSALQDAAVGATSALGAADELCRACVELLDVDGAAISLMHERASRGTFGSSGILSRRLDDFQFTFGEGPCLDAVADRCPILVPDLAAPTERRWPAYTAAVLEAGVRAVFALPVSLGATPVGAIDFFCLAPGTLGTDRLAGGLQAAELAALPLLDLIGAAASWTTDDDTQISRPQVASLERIEVYQATGMIMTQLDVGAPEALVRLRAHAFAHNMTAAEVARQVVERALTFHNDGTDTRDITR
jgi:hypothetical protein